MMNSARTFISAVLAGFAISLGGIVFLMLDSKPLGAMMFTVGLFTVCTMGFSLFTGKVCYVFDNDASYALALPVIVIGNFTGTWLTSFLIGLTRISHLSEKARSLCEVKLNDGLLSVFVLAVFCNVLIYIAVEGYRNNRHQIGKYLALFFGVMVFILCGFEHCVANMFYISAAGVWSGKAVVFILVNIIGNALGGILIPLARQASSPPLPAKK